MNLKHPFISVIIPTYHDWQRLQLCLDAIDTQSYPKEKFEIIVVNNDPLDFPSGMTWPNNCSVVVESKSGSYAARNKGASHAKGKVFSFTDADCIPDKNWLSEIASHYSYNKGILSGSVIMFSVRANSKLNFTESYDYIFGINQEIYKRSKVAATANLSVTSEEFFLNDGFRSDMFSGGDIDFCKRAINKGIKFNFSESSYVKHPLRNNFKDLIVKAKRLSGGKVYQNKFKGIFLAMMPPLVRLKILFFEKKAPFSIKVKCFIVLFYIKIIQFFEALFVFVGAKCERE